MWYGTEGGSDTVFRAMAFSVRRAGGSSLLKEVGEVELFSLLG